MIKQEQDSMLWYVCVSAFRSELFISQKTFTIMQSDPKGGIWWRYFWRS